MLERWGLRVVATTFLAAALGCAVQKPRPASEPAPSEPVAVVAPPDNAANVTAGAPTSPPDAGRGDAAAQVLGMMVHLAANQSYCMDAAPVRGASQRSVRLYICHGQENQHWSLAPGESRVGPITGPGGLCLEAPGTNAQLAGCGGEHQQWNFDPGGRLREAASGKCLTVNKAARGTPLTMQTCDPGNPGQVWTLADR